MLAILTILASKIRADTIPATSGDGGYFLCFQSTRQLWMDEESCGQLWMNLLLTASLFRLARRLPSADSRLAAAVDM
jgi:hypothetical protein